jgi:hypothetical protein
MLMNQAETAQDAVLTALEKEKKPQRIRKILLPQTKCISRRGVRCAVHGREYDKEGHLWQRKKRERIRGAGAW